MTIDPRMFRDDYEKPSPDGPVHYTAFINRVPRCGGDTLHVERSRLAIIRCPALIIMGDHDFYPVEVALHIAQAIPGAQLMIVPDTGHGTFMGRPELMNLAVLEFLDSESSSPVTHSGRRTDDSGSVAPCRLPVPTSHPDR